MFTNKVCYHFTQKQSGATENPKQVAIFKSNIQPASDASTALINGQYGRTFTAFTTYSGLNIGDTITTSGSTTISGHLYNIRGIRDFAYGPLPHYEVTITLPEI